MEKGQHWLDNLPLAALMALAAIFIGAIYFPVSHFDFVWDDTHLFVTSDFYRNQDAWRNALLKPFSLTSDYYRPFAVLTFVAEHRLHGMNAGLMHITGLLIHIGNAILTGLLSTLLIRMTVRHETAKWFGFFAALAYGLHYGLLEMPVWISCRFDLLYTFFLLLTILLDHRIQSHWRAGLLMGASFLIAAASKESAAIFAIVLPCWHFAVWRLSSSQRSFSSFLLERWPRYACTALAGIIYLVARWAVMPEFFPIQQASSFSSAWLPWWTADIYLRLSLLPFGYVSPLYPTPLPHWQYVPLLVIAILLSIFAASWRHKGTQASFVLFIAAVIAIFPALNITPLNLLGTFAATRYLAFPLALIIIAIAILASQIHRLRILVITAITWITLSAANIIVTLPLWSNELSLWTWTSEKYPDSSYAMTNKISEIIGTVSHEEALQLIENALEKHPENVELKLNKALVYLYKEEPEKALRVLNTIQGEETFAGFAQAYRDYRITAKLLLCTNPDDVVIEAQRNIDSAPDSANARLLMAIVYYLNNQADEAENAYLEAESTVLESNKKALQNNWRAWKKRIDIRCRGQKN